jgi:hypothetical protein
MTDTNPMKPSTPRIGQPSTWADWSEEEQIAWTEWQASIDRLTATETAVQAYLPPERRAAFLELEANSLDPMWELATLFQARLNRFLPQYRDLIAFAFSADQVAGGDDDD